jgi:hypothetical protein
MESSTECCCITVTQDVRTTCRKVVMQVPLIMEELPYSIRRFSSTKNTRQMSALQGQQKSLESRSFPLFRLICVRVGRGGEHSSPAKTEFFELFYSPFNFFLYSSIKELRLLSRFVRFVHGPLGTCPATKSTVFPMFRRYAAYEEEIR